MATSHATCPECETGFERHHGSRRYCTTTCREAAKWKRMSKVPCSNCGKDTGYKVGSVDQATCNTCRRTTITHGVSGYRHGCRCDVCRSEVAASHAAYMARRRTSGHLPCSHPECERTRAAQGLCGMHLKRKQKAEGIWKKSPSDAWNTPRRLARYKTRKATIRGAVARGAHFLVDDLIARDGRACGICGDTMPDVRYPDMDSPSIDHITPVSRGGEHTLSNVRATHLRCNIARGNRD